jgi:hypothetical protein
MHRLGINVAFLLIVAAVAALGADTNEITLFKHQARWHIYEWRISEDRILATPEWRFEKKIPIPPDKAVKIAKRWLEKRGGLDSLMEIYIRPFVIKTAYSDAIRPLERRFYYVIHCRPGGVFFDSMKVVVLMDGSVLEPKEIREIGAEK